MAQKFAPRENILLNSTINKCMHSHTYDLNSEADKAIAHGGKRFFVDLRPFLWMPILWVKSNEFQN